MAALDNTKGVAGLVKKIRESEDTQEWDLAGYAEQQIEGLVAGAFKDPVRLSQMSEYGAAVVRCACSHFTSAGQARPNLWFFSCATSFGAVRHTFVVGGGKKVRQKYDEKLPKTFSASLREHGYEEASAHPFDDAKYPPPSV